MRKIDVELGNICVEPKIQIRICDLARRRPKTFELSFLARQVLVRLAFAFLDGREAIGSPLSFAFQNPVELKAK